MNHPDIDYMIVMERRREALAEAAQSRLFTQARASLETRDSLETLAGDAPRGRFARGYTRVTGALALGLARLLSWAGENMLAWSCQLQVRGARFAIKAADLQPAAEAPSAPCAS